MKDHFVVSMASTSVSNSAKRSGSFSEEEEQLFVSLLSTFREITFFMLCVTRIFKSYFECLKLVTLN
jgi:hypothetical protein